LIRDYLLHDAGLHVFVQSDLSLQSFFSLVHFAVHDFASVFCLPVFVSPAAKELVPEISKMAIIPANIFFMFDYFF
jgi:hypothetical protein